MEKYVILEKTYNSSGFKGQYSLRRFIDSGITCKLLFLTLVEVEYSEGYLYEDLQKRWSEKGTLIGFDIDLTAMLDEPSGLIYIYSDFEYLENFYYTDARTKIESSFGPEQTQYYKDNPDDYPCQVDYFREGKAPFYYTMHKSNFFELFLAFDVCAKADKNYAVWYEDYTGWVHLKGFDTQEQAHDFVAHN